MAIWYENQGFYEQAKTAYENVISRAREMHNYAPAPPSMLSEYKLWEQHWMKCAHELGQWDVLTDFGKSLGGVNPFPGMSNAPMTQARVQIENFEEKFPKFCEKFPFPQIL